MLAIWLENTAPGAECLVIFCAGSGSLQLGTVLVHDKVNAPFLCRQKTE